MSNWIRPTTSVIFFSLPFLIFSTFELAPLVHAHTLTQQPHDEVLVSSYAHDINFPEEILFSIEGSSKVQLLEIKLVLQIGNSGVITYRYVKVDQDIETNGFEGTTTLATNGRSYIPSGVSIKYYFEVTDAQENNYYTHPTNFTYLDPRYSWKSMNIDPITVHWHGFSEDEVYETIQRTRGQVSRIRDIVGVDEVQPIKGIIINTPGEALKTFPPVSEAATRDGLYGGFAFKDYDLFMVGGLNANSMIHETVHLIVGQSIDSPFSKIPAWLNEGLAMHFESQTPIRAHEITERIRKGDLPSLSTMKSVPGRPEDVRLFYAQSNAIVEHMMDKFGEHKMPELLSELKSGSDIESSLKKVYGLTSVELQEDWEENLLPTFNRKLIVDPGTFWTSSMLAGVFIVAITIMGIKWLRGKINGTDKSTYYMKSNGSGDDY